jgi:hypothetical protein
VDSNQCTRPVERLVGFGGDPFVAAALEGMTPSQRDTYLRAYYAPEYRRELQRLRDWAVPGPEDEDAMTGSWF